MKIPISILESKLPEYRERLKRYQMFTHMKDLNKKQIPYFDNLVKSCEQEISQIEMAIEILLNHE
jgi:hypothetical protein